MSNPLQCKHCTNHTNLDEAGARHLGWRIFRGLSQTGKQLDDIVCPLCSGRGGVPSGAQPPKPPTWDVQCDICEWSFKDEYDELFDDPLVDAYDVDRASREHECEPTFKFIAPDGAEYHSWTDARVWYGLVQMARDERRKAK